MRTLQVQQKHTSWNSVRSQRGGSHVFRQCSTKGYRQLHPQADWAAPHVKRLQSAVNVNSLLHKIRQENFAQQYLQLLLLWEAMPQSLTSLKALHTRPPHTVRCFPTWSSQHMAAAEFSSQASHRWAHPRNTQALRLAALHRLIQWTRVHLRWHPECLKLREGECLRQILRTLLGQSIQCTSSFPVLPHHVVPPLATKNDLLVKCSFNTKHLPKTLNTKRLLKTKKKRYFAETANKHDRSAALKSYLQAKAA